MAYDFVAASSQSLDVTPAVLTNLPMTFAALFNSTSDSTAQAIVGQAVTSTITQQLNANGSAAGDPLQAQFGITQVASSTTGYVINTWMSGVGVLASTSSRTVYLNGGSEATNTNSTTATTPSGTSIGRVPRTSGSNLFFSGQICEVAIWDVALTKDEAVSLSKGFKPYRIRPQSLVFYAPLIRNLQDTKGARAITNNNSATVAGHPRVI